MNNSTPLTHDMTNAELTDAIYSNAARAIVARIRKLELRARVRWTPALAIDLDNARSSRESFILGARYNDGRREYRAALIANAER